VLVVDDQESIRVLTQRWLVAAGYSVLAVAGADEALAAMAAHEPGVVVTDVRLGEHDGLWLARHIRATFPDTSVVFISGDPAAGPLLARAGIGAFDYLAKPFTTAQLTEAVDRSTAYYAERVVLRAQRATAAADAVLPLWSYDERDHTWVQQADWLPSPLAVSRLVADMHLRGVRLQPDA
jgi:two-component system C4-dicarboxylate transport response regulator DctD